MKNWKRNILLVVVVTVFILTNNHSVCSRTGDFHSAFYENRNTCTRTNERKEKKKKKWITASWINYDFKGIEKENANVAIILMAIQLSFNSIQLSRKHAGIYMYNFFYGKKSEKKHGKNPLKTLFSLCSFGSHTMPAMPKRARVEWKTKVEKKGIVCPGKYAHQIRSFCFLYFRTLADAMIAYDANYFCNKNNKQAGKKKLQTRKQA